MLCCWYNTSIAVLRANGMTQDAPKCFISYSWTSPEHEEWVLQFATELRESGVDVILDKWDLKEGQDANAFMEKMVTDAAIRKVVLVCDARYVDKANNRSGGVGTEAQIISPKIYERTDQTKFVAVIRELNADGKPYVPAYYGGRIHIDLSSEDLYAQNFEQLVRWVFDKPLHVKPRLGVPPAFLSDLASLSLSNGATYRRAIDAIRTGKPYANGVIDEYLSSCVSGLENFRIKRDGSAFDDTIIASIESFLPYRNEINELFSLVAQYKNDADTRQMLHRFFERLLPLLEAPEHLNSYNELDFDNFRFIVHELYLYLIAILLKHECFDFAGYMMQQRYYRPAGRRESSAVSFVAFRSYMKSLELRNNRLQLRRLSVRADLLKDRCKATIIEFRHLAQADFVLFMRSSIDALASDGGNARYQQWWPETLLFVREYEGSLEIFARGESASYFERMKVLLGVRSKSDFEKVFEAFAAQKLYIPKWEFETISPKRMMGFECLATRP